MYKFKNSLIAFAGLLFLIGVIALVASAGHARVNGNTEGRFGPPIVGLWRVVITSGQ